MMVLVQDAEGKNVGMYGGGCYTHRTMDVSTPAGENENTVTLLYQRH